MQNGYIKLYRKMTEWEWYTDIPVRILFEHCLLKANHKSNKWRGQVIEQGSFITSYEKLSIETGLTIRQVRTALNKLKTTGEVTHEGQSQYSIITVKNWIDYQESDKQNDKRMTSERQTSDKRATTNNNDKNEKNDKNMFNTVCINSEKNTKKIDPFSNPLIRYFKDEYFKRFNCRPYLTATERNKIFELASDIEEFKETIPVTLEKLKNIDFGFENFTPNANWLLKDSNYTAVLNGTYDKQKKKTIWEELKERHNGTT